MQSFLEFLTKALVYTSIIILVTTILMFIMLLLVDKRRIKPNAPVILLWSTIGGMTVLIITSVLIATGVLPHISVALPDIDVSPYIGN